MSAAVQAWEARRLALNTFTEHVKHGPYVKHGPLVRDAEDKPVHRNGAQNDLGTQQALGRSDSPAWDHGAQNAVACVVTTPSCMCPPAADVCQHGEQSGASATEEAPAALRDTRAQRGVERKAAGARRRARTSMQAHGTSVRIHWMPECDAPAGGAALEPE